MRTGDWAKEWMGIVNNERLKVGTHPVLIANAMGQLEWESLGVRSIEMEGGSKDRVILVWLGIYQIARLHPRYAVHPAL